MRNCWLILYIIGVVRWDAPSSAAAANERISALEQQLAAAGATVAALEAQLAQARTESISFHQHLDDARRDFAAELDKLRGAAQLAEERFHAAKKRALMEIDRERGTAAQTEDRHRLELGRLQDQFGDLRQKAGVLEGNPHAVTTARGQALNELSTLKTRLEQMTVEAAAWRERASLAEQSADSVKTKAAHTPRKPRAS